MIPYFPNIDFRQKRVLITKCVHLVYEMIKYAMNRSPFIVLKIRFYILFRPNFFLFNGFWRLKNRKIGFLVVFEGHIQVQSDVIVYFPPKTNIVLKPIRMVLEGPKF